MGAPAAARAERDASRACIMRAMEEVGKEERLRAARVRAPSGAADWMRVRPG
jgi:hypothetical protein